MVPNKQSDADEPVRENNREKMMSQDDPGTHKTPRWFPGAFAPFPRSTWIHPHVPNDNFDRVCGHIWRRAREAGEEPEPGPVRGAPERQQDERHTAPESRTTRAKEQQKEADDSGLSSKCKEDEQQFHTDSVLPCPYLSGRRHPHVSKPARVLSPVMEEEMKRNEGVAKGRNILWRDVEDKLRIVATKSNSTNAEQSSASEPRPLVQNPVCCAPEDHSTFMQTTEDPLLLSKLPEDACESEIEKSLRSGSDSSSSDYDNVVTLPRLRNCATDSSDDDSLSDDDDWEEEVNETPYSDELSSDSKQDSPCSSPENASPPLSTIKVGIIPCPTEPPASGKMHGQWEIPLSFHPHDIPTDTLASCATAQAQAPVQDKAEPTRANSKTSVPPAGQMQHISFDLLADFPALKPPEKPLALGVVRGRIPEAYGAEGKRGHTLSPNHRQESGASHQRRMENVPHEVSSICAVDQKSVLDLQKFGSTAQLKSPTISRGEAKANNPPLPGVAGTDGGGVNARTWASAAKAGMKQAAAPQEKARPCTFQQTVAINTAKAGVCSARHSPNEVTPSHQTATLMAATMCQGPRPHHPKRILEPEQVEPPALRDSDVPVILPNRPEVILLDAATWDDSHCDDTKSLSFC
ncbi:uncharacterized protein LOC119016523 isoform X4 [Acanthopagrus latus]|uniref:uncharacterized protein LOC119016523 isoform X4 n=1 Tax=Acanthopagrus latus TaxID=8177 RepID=UPI00187BD7F9|nr:uncharacterized protein LOC119016523 isoform X4 [Acanthopagrus latus]